MRSVMVSPGMLKVNSDGTGALMVWPRATSQSKPVALGAAAGGDDDPVEPLAVEVKPAAVQRLDGLDRGLHPDVDAGLSGLAKQAR